MEHIDRDRYYGKRMESVQSSNSSKIAISAIWGHFRTNQKLSRWTTVKKNATNQVLKLFLKILICRLRFLHSYHRAKLFYNCSAAWGDFCTIVRTRSWRKTEVSPHRDPKTTK